MKKAFKLEGLDCANCAAKIEHAVKKLAGVNDASVNFLTTKMVIEGDDGQIDEIVQSAHAVIRKLEPDVVIRKA
jgi:copper chaperone CopZ